MTVNLTRIYTRLGDGGETHLGDMSRVPKTDPRIEAYGTVDELGAHLGVALTLAGPAAAHARLAAADPERPLRRRRRPRRRRRATPRERLRVLPEQVDLARAALRRGQRELEPLRSFVLSGGTPAAAWLHVCRTVCRRAERRVVALGDDASPETLRYLNRLCDLLFILAAAPTAARSRSGSRAATAKR